jgi:hypothetical protein
MYPPIDDPQTIESRRSRDSLALGDLERLVNTRRVAQEWPPFPATEYRKMKLPPLEEMITLLGRFNME